MLLLFQQIIKTEQGAINKEIKQRKNLEKVRDKKPGDAHSIVSLTNSVMSLLKAVGQQESISP